MVTSNHKSGHWFVKKITIIFLVVGLTQGVFAVDGTMNGGGSKKKFFLHD